MATYRSDQGWEALADVTRRSIVERLAERPRAVGELAAGLPVSRPAVSQHLKVLKDAGLVTERAEGTRRIYRLNQAGVSALRDQLDAFWNRALTGYQDVVEQSTVPMAPLAGSLRTKEKNNDAGSGHRGPSANRRRRTD